jgi:hypothetical protein
MKINQLNDKYGSGEIVFTDEEIEIIKEKKKISLPAESLKHCTNLFVSLAIECNKKFTQENTQLISHMGQDIKTK